MSKRNSKDAQDSPARRQLSTRRKMIYSGLALVLFLGSVEITARVLFNTKPRGRFGQISQIVSFLSEEESALILDSDPETFWKLRPGVVITAPKSILFQGRVSNSLGYRNEEFSLARPDSTTRIVCFGDSSTFGIGTPQNETWPAQLETALNADSEFLQTQLVPASPETRVDVVNAGVPGYTSYQILRKMRREMKSLAPDVVLLTCANNDFWRWDNRTDADQAKHLAGSAIRNSLMQSHAVQLADQLYGHLTRGSATNDAEWARKASLNYFKPEESWTPRVPLDEFKFNLEQMAMICEEQRVPLALVIWPDQLQAAGKWSIRVAYHEAMFKVATERNLLIVDIATAFQQRRWSVHCYIPNDIVHVNAEGNRIAAEAARSTLDQIFPRQSSSQQFVIPAGFTSDPAQ